MNIITAENRRQTPSAGLSPSAGLRDNVPWRSKVDDRGNTHLYKRVIAGELRVGDHLLEHIAGHKRQVATPILNIQHVADGVIVTIPDRHSNNAPVDELYAFDKPLFISKTPHLEQHNPKENLFSQLDKKEETIMEMKTHIAGIHAGQNRIDRAVENLILTVNPELAKEAAGLVREGAVDLSNIFILGTDALEEHNRNSALDPIREAALAHADELRNWNTCLTESADFTKSNAARLEKYENAVSNVELQKSAAYARGALDTATMVAIEQRKRSILVTLDGPFGEFALADAKDMGLVSEPKPEEKGRVLAQIPPEAVLLRDDGTMVVVPVLEKLEVGKPVAMSAGEHGVYGVFNRNERKTGMEKRTEAKKQYPRMEGHLQTKEGTWHSVSMFVDKEGQAHGAVVVDNKALGIIEKVPVDFEERVSQKTGEKFLSTKLEQTNGTTLHVNLMPHEKDGERWLSASFAQHDPAKEKGKQLTGIEGKGGGMKPNAALLEKENPTAKYLRETLKVDPVKIHEREQARKGRGMSA